MHKGLKKRTEAEALADLLAEAMMVNWIFRHLTQKSLSHNRRG